MKVSTIGSKNPVKLVIENVTDKGSLIMCVKSNVSPSGSHELLEGIVWLKGFEGNYRKLNADLIKELETELNTRG